MRSRPIRVFVRLNESEYKKFLGLVEKSGLKKSLYLRQLINGLKPKDQPSKEYYKIMEILYSIDNQLNNFNSCQKEDLKEISVKIEDVICKMTTLFISPEKLRG